MSIETHTLDLNSVVALIISIIALIYTVKTYLLKSGVSVRGTYVTCSSIQCEDRYISSLTLENLKDRAVVIFKVYLKIGHNYFVELENFEENPLILKPFEVYKTEYDAIDLYSVNSSRVIIDDLLENIKVKKQLMLSTSTGRYTVRTQLERWDPVIDFFNNHMTVVIRPLRSTFKGKSYGMNAKYIVELKMENGAEEVIAIYPHDYQIKKFRKFNLTEDSLVTKEALEKFLHSQITAGLLGCREVTVFEMEKWRSEIYERENRRVIRASYDNWFMYHIVGRISTIIQNYKLKKRNIAIQRKNEKISHKGMF